MLMNKIPRPSVGADLSRAPPMMNFNDRNRECHSVRWDCHAERSEESVSPGAEILRGVYTERSECAQNDTAGLDR